MLDTGPVKKREVTAEVRAEVRATHVLSVKLVSACSTD